MRKRRRLLRRGLSIILLLLTVVFLYGKLKRPEDVIAELCAEDRKLNLTSDCSCDEFHFAATSRMDSFMNFFNGLGERHKTILYLRRLVDGQKVVLKYPKDTRPSAAMETQEGHPHFCTHPVGGSAFDIFARRLERSDDAKVARINGEMILLKFLKPATNLPVPRFLGTCGLYLMESYGGAMMGGFYKSRSVRQRLTIAKNVLQGALDLTRGFRGFRIYLTDATRDNIAVDEESLAVTFIDLDDVIVQFGELFETSPQDRDKVHVHRKIECDNCFAYSTNDICAAPVSDINVFTICQLLLEDLKDDPKGGFLYFEDSQLKPFSVGWRERWQRLLDALRDCVYCDRDSECQRFERARDLIIELEHLIETAD